MAHPPPQGALNVAQIRAFIDQGAKEGAVFTMIWSHAATPNSSFVWHFIKAIIKTRRK